MDSQKTNVAWREIALHAAVLTVALAFVFPGVFLRGEVIAPGDTLFITPPWSHYAPEGYTGFKNKTLIDYLTAFYPIYAAAKSAIEQGEWPLWNPRELGGMPLLANYQSAVLYPPHLLHLWMDLPWAITLRILLRLWLCGMTAYLCARTIRLSPGVSRFFSLAWMLGSYNLLWSYWPLTDITAWLPVMFMAIEFALGGAYRKGFFTCAGGGVMMMLGGHPETAFTASLGLGLYFLARLVLDRQDGRPCWKPIGSMALAWTLILLVCAAQLLPFFEYLGNSYTLGWHNQYGDAFYWPFRALLSFWAPRYFLTSASNRTWGFPIPYYVAMMYIGLATWLGISLLATRLTQPFAHRRRALALIAAMMPCLLIPFHPPSLEWLLNLPVFRWTFSVYFAVFPLFALTLLGALGIDRWFAQRRRLAETAWLLLVIVPVVALAAAFYRFDAPLMHSLRIDDQVHRALGMAAILAALGVVVFAASCRWWRPRIAVAALSLILSVDLVMAVRGLEVTSPRSYLYPPTALTDYLRALPQPARVTSDFAGIPAGILSCYGIEELMGYEGIYPARMMRLQQALKASVWQAFEPVYASEYYLNDARFEPMFPVDRPGYFEKIATYDGIGVYRNRKALPRAYLAGSLEVLPSTDALIEQLGKPGWNPAGQVFTDVPPPKSFKNGVLASMGTAKVIRRTATRVSIEAEATGEAVLVLSDAYYPGWHAQIDGQDTPVFPVYHAYRGLIVPEGRHTIEFEYRPWTFRLGLAISTCTLLASVVYSASRLRDMRGARRR